jgi:hypothetical protein
MTANDFEIFGNYRNFHRFCGQETSIFLRSKNTAVGSPCGGGGMTASLK